MSIAWDLMDPFASLYGKAFPKDKHEKVNHHRKLRDKGFIESTRTVESAFSLFKRGIVGSYHKMSRDHMDSYLQEFCWRFNRRAMQEHMFDMLLTEVATKKPLTYKTLTRERRSSGRVSSAGRRGCLT